MKNLKDKLIKLGSEKPDLQDSIRPVLDSLTKQSVPNDKARQKAIGYLQKTKKKAEESAREMRSARSYLIIQLDDLQRVLEQVGENSWADFAGQIKKQLKNQTKRGDPVSKTISMIKDFPF